ncbi:uncharacterized protein CIMG_00129 [Coccidioides immitis RS]|uniref:Uncharacterized protein n=2 Tax=Coccidioides immitis TaxID=5501 RepID=J3KGC3_COCIM|nr:uncharacterized protein CIMG_00129 [Coccidioides immitis RS]EAS34775.3 hypothetical protein CIMG_00129 [Coccidioides immitis RS]KMO99951.1 hypothetical protein CIRG_00094 [Coccidioides immitis RMSCC 2394]
MTELAGGLGSASTFCGLTTKINVALPVGSVDKAWTKETSIKIGEREVHAVLKPMRFPMIRNCTGMGVWMGRNASIQARKVWAQQCLLRQDSRIFRYVWFKLEIGTVDHAKRALPTRPVF